MSKLCKRFVFVFMLLIPFTVMSQEEYDYRAGDIFFNVNGGLDYNINAFRSSSDSKGFEYYGINPHFNFGFDIGVMVSEKFRPRIEAKYMNMGYGQYWPDIFTTFEKTITKIDNLGLNLQFDYLIINKDKFKAFISPGIQTDLALNDRFKTYKTDDDDTDSRFSDLEQYYPKAIMGGGLSVMFKYEINEYIGITFEPKYTVFFRSYMESNSNLYQRINANVGLEFRLH